MLISSGLQTALVVLLALGGAACDPVTKYVDCGSKAGKIVSLDVTPCPKLPCQLPRGSSVQIKITFLPSENSTSVKAVVHGIIAGLPVPFPLPDTNACHSMAPACPVTAGTQSLYSSTLEVKQSYPAVGVVVKWELADPKGVDFVCLEVPARLV